MMHVTFRCETRMVSGYPPKNAMKIEESGTCGAVFSQLPDGTIRVLVFVPPQYEDGDDE